MDQLLPMCIRTCVQCKQERVCREYLVIRRGLLYVARPYQWFCLDCVQHQWWFRAMPLELRQEIINSYAAIEQETALERWLSSSLGGTRYTALCESAAALGARAG